MNDEALWQPNYFRLFLSHAGDGREFAGVMKDRLSGFRIEAFVAHEDIAPTLPWVEVIEQALKTCHALAALLTPDFHESDWTDQEIGYCLSRDVLILPLRLGLTPYGFIGRYQALRGINLSPYTLAAKICEALIGNEQTVERMTGALVLAFEKSFSFESAKVIMSLLEKAPSLSQRQLQRIEESIGKNRQVERSGGVPDRIRQLIERHSR